MGTRTEPTRTGHRQRSEHNTVWVFHVFAFMLGAAWGSFLNVVIYRLPRRLSLVSPGSFCPSCETPIKAYDNVPIFGWLWLRGRCRACKVRISPRYPLVELLVALLALGLSFKVCHGRLDLVMAGRAQLMELIVPWIFLFAFVLANVALFFIDLDVTELPPEITLPGTLVGLAFAYAVPEVGILADLTPNVTLGDAALGAALGGGLILVLLLGYFLLTRRIGLGGGDLWMMGMVGAFVGWQGLLFIYLASSLQGIVVALIANLGGRREGASLFRNAQVAELEQELGLLPAASATPVDAGPAGIGEPGNPADEAPNTRPAVRETDGVQEQAHDADEHQDFGKLAIPFGPFIALSAVEYVFAGHILLPLMTGGVLGPNGWLL